MFVSLNIYKAKEVKDSLDSIKSNALLHQRMNSRKNANAKAKSSLKCHLFNRYINMFILRVIAV